MTRLRLLKVIVQPVFVVDDGDELRELAVQPREVSPQEWPTFATTQFVEGVEALRAEVEAGQ